MKKSEMVKCFFSGRKASKCKVCKARFICLTNKWTEEDKLAYAKTVASCVLRVPNTMEGQAFYQQFKKYLNTERWRAERKGRAKNRKEKGGCQSNTPIGNCDYFGVYLRDSELIIWQRTKGYEDENDAKW